MFQTRRGEVDFGRLDHELQQLLRMGVRERSAAGTFEQRLENRSVGARDWRPLRESAQDWHQRANQTCRRHRAKKLSPSLRRSLVDGHPVERISFAETRRSCAAKSASEKSEVHFVS